MFAAVGTILLLLSACGVLRSAQPAVVLKAASNAAQAFILVFPTELQPVSECAPQLFSHHYRIAIQTRANAWPARWAASDAKAHHSVLSASRITTASTFHAPSPCLPPTTTVGSSAISSPVPRTALSVGESFAVSVLRGSSSTRANASLTVVPTSTS